VYVFAARNPRIPDWIRDKSANKLKAHIKGEILMVVPETADGVWATIGALQYLEEGEGVSFPTFYLPEDRCVRMFLNLGKRVTTAEFQEELEALHMSVQAVMQLRSKRRVQDPDKKHPVT
jgi:metal-responsive CopG/Arc/MetJ family transcriptional regulator